MRSTPLFFHGIWAINETMIPRELALKRDECKKKNLRTYERIHPARDLNNNTVTLLTLCRIFRSQMSGIRLFTRETRARSRADWES